MPPNVTPRHVSQRGGGGAGLRLASERLLGPLDCVCASLSSALRPVISKQQALTIKGVRGSSSDDEKVKFVEQGNEIEISAAVTAREHVPHLPCGGDKFVLRLQTFVCCRRIKADNENTSDVLQAAAPPAQSSVFHYSVFINHCVSWLISDLILI